MLLEHGRRMKSINIPMRFEYPPPIMGIITKHSPLSVDEALLRLEEAMRSRSTNLFAHINRTEETKWFGLKMQEAHVLIFGNPKAGTPLMIASSPLTCHSRCSSGRVVMVVCG